VHESQRGDIPDTQRLQCHPADPSRPPRCLASAAVEHPNATFARNLYATLAAGDVATAFWAAVRVPELTAP
jgi:hypothetical protein